MIRSCAAGAVLLAAALASAPASATMELAFGLVDEIDGQQTGMATLAHVTADPMPWEFLLGQIRERRKDGRQVSPTANFVAVSRQLQWRGWFLNSGVALTDTRTDNEVLSGAFQFFSGGGWRNERVAVSLRHLSNANLRGRNRGETFLLVAWRW